LTTTDYRRRLNHLAAAAEWRVNNPFRQPLLDRLDRMGGLHRTPPTDTGTPNEEARIAHARDVAEAMAEPACEF